MCNVYLASLVHVFCIVFEWVLYLVQDPGLILCRRWS